MILTPADLPRFENVPEGCWVQDIDRARVTWANEAAVRTLRAGSREALYARDSTPRSEASRTRLSAYRERVATGQSIRTQWTTLADGVMVTLLADVMAFRLPEGRTALFFSTRNIDDSVCPEGLRMLEVARHSVAYLALFTLEGQVLEQNAAFTRQFGERRDVPGDQFLALFTNASEGERVRSEVATLSCFRGRVRVRLGGEDRWHMLLANAITDPVSAERILHVELIDIADQVEAEGRARDAEHLLQVIADEVAHPIAFVDADKTYRFVNKTYSQWLLKPREAIIGHPMRTVAGAQVEALWDQHWPALARGERAGFERQASFPGRGERWISVDLVPHTSGCEGVDGAIVLGYDVHALKIAQSELKSSERRLALVANSLPLAVATVDVDMRLRFANAALCRWFSLRPESVIGRHASEVIGIEAFEETAAERQRALAGETVLFRRTSVAEGRTRYIDCTLAPLLDEAGRTDGVVVVYQDVTRRVEADVALHRMEGALASHLANTPLAVIQLDSQRRVIQWTGRAQDIFGWPAADAQGRAFGDLALFEEEGRSRFDEQLRALEQGQGERFTSSAKSVRRDGNAMHGEWYVSVLRDASGAVTSYLLLVQDVSARVTAEHHLQYVATHDLLTGFANRAQFEERLKSDIARARRLQSSLAVLLVDLDRFVYVNESLGHQSGDALLQQVALRLRACVLEGELIARTGADEFMILADLAHDERRAANVAEQIQAEIGRPFVIAGHEVYITASVGVAVFPTDALGEIDLIKNADWALYCAKDGGRNRVQFFSGVLARENTQRLIVEADLRRAIERSQLELHYQPKLNLATRRLTGVEALIRWRHPERGLIPPDQFIGLAEESGLIIEIGRWVIEEACRQIADWRARYGTSPPVAVNLSAVQLRRPELADEILAELALHQIPGSLFMVEVTETSVVSDPLLATVTLLTLRDHGVRAAIDDFGKGFSSLSQLKRLPIDALKIDNSFVRDVIVDREGAAIVQAIIGLARNLHLNVIAEGVETPEQLAFLLASGCSEAQGYLISRPLPAPDLARGFLEVRAEGAYVAVLDGIT